MYRSFAALRMTAKRIPVILSGAKDLCTVFANSAEQKRPYPVFGIPQVSATILFFPVSKSVERA